MARKHTIRQAMHHKKAAGVTCGLLCARLTPQT